MRINNSQSKIRYAVDQSSVKIRTADGFYDIFYFIFSDAFNKNNSLLLRFVGGVLTLRPLE
jgi:hypothetical protein